MSKAFRPRKGVIADLLALEAALDDEIKAQTNDAILAPLLNVSGALSHLKDSLALEHHRGRI